MLLLKPARQHKNKAGYMAQDAPSRRLREGVTDQRTDRRMDGQTDTPSYRDATAHRKKPNSMVSILNFLHFNIPERAWFSAIGTLIKAWT